MLYRLSYSTVAFSILSPPLRRLCPIHPLTPRTLHRQIASLPTSPIRSALIAMWHVFIITIILSTLSTLLLFNAAPSHLAQWRVVGRHRHHAAPCRTSPPVAIRRPSGQPRSRPGSAPCAKAQTPPATTDQQPAWTHLNPAQSTPANHPQIDGQLNTHGM